MTSGNKRIKFQYLWLYAIVVASGLALGIFVGVRQLNTDLHYSHAQLLPAVKIVPEFSLLNQQQLPITQNLWRGRWSLVFFGFTSCPDICPLELQKLAKLLRLVESDIALQVVFISVDPERDTPAKLGDYTGFFHPDIVALSGDNMQLASAAQFFGAAYDRSVIIDSKLLRVPAGIGMPDNAGQSYQVNHSARVFIVNPDGAYVGSFMPPFETGQLWDDLEKMID